MKKIIKLLFVIAVITTTATFTFGQIVVTPEVIQCRQQAGNVFAECVRQYPGNGEMQRAMCSPAWDAQMDACQLLGGLPPHEETHWQTIMNEDWFAFLNLWEICTMQ